MTEPLNMQQVVDTLFRKDRRLEVIAGRGVDVEEAGEVMQH